jgi:hypothetical protein
LAISPEPGTPLPIHLHDSPLPGGGPAHDSPAFLGAHDFFDDRGGNSNDKPFDERAKTDEENMANLEAMYEMRQKQLISDRDRPRSGNEQQPSVDEKARMTADAAALQPKIDRLNQILGHIKTDNAKALAFDPRDPGVLVELIGDINPGNKLAVIVTGTNTNILGAESNYQTCKSFHDKDPGIATINWVGGEFPQAIFNGFDNDATESRYEKDLAPRLVDFGRAVDQEIASRGGDVPVTYIGHSYGGPVVGEAEHLGLRANRVMRVESAGAGNGVEHLSDYPNRNVPRYTMYAPGDPIILAQGGGPHGTIPGPNLDMKIVPTGRYHIDPTTGRELHGHAEGEHEEGASAHGDVFDPYSDSWLNILKVIEGTYSD